MVLVDTNVIIDVLDSDPAWSAWSLGQLRRFSALDVLAINNIIYAEISPRFSTSVAVDAKLEEMGLVLVGTPRTAAFLAAKVYVQYRKHGGNKLNVLSDFFIGAHATVQGCPLLTRDSRRYAGYFPTVRLIAP
jgi:predicted nucleic acid-binding protein